ncbi:unnamed protein product [Pipistrellus nathusii]|uniref:Uncharacterized protein n=1 Tax=Pipistrellus nathusii TaxID=59473 RepID=A0ABN9ZM74_PIPNA
MIFFLKKKLLTVSSETCREALCSDLNEEHDMLMVVFFLFLSEHFSFSFQQFLYDHLPFLFHSPQKTKQKKMGGKLMNTQENLYSYTSTTFSDLSQFIKS